MALKSMLGFGMMRLPVLNDDPTDFNYPLLDEMVDTYLASGNNYFDTSYVYHNGKSQIAVREAVVKRHPRDSFLLATKFPTFFLNPGDESKIEGYFQNQLNDLGTDYIDYYLLHNFQTRFYDGYDGKGGVIKSEHLIDHAIKWKEEGKIRHLGFSFHSSAKLLDRILTEHPEFEFVQIALNYADWNSQLVQAGECYDVIRRHGKKAVIMEPVKGGALAVMPKKVEEALIAKDADRSIASWAIQFVGSLDGLICTLSGMSTPEQVKDNVKTYAEKDPLSDENMKWLRQDINHLWRSCGPCGDDLSKYEGVTLYGVPASAIVEGYNACQLCPDPGFADDNNYLLNAVAENYHRNFKDNLPHETLINKNGEDVTEEVYQAYNWLKGHTF